MDVLLGQAAAVSARQHMYMYSVIQTAAEGPRGFFLFVEPGPFSTTTPCSAGIQNDHLAGGIRHCGAKWQL